MKKIQHLSVLIECGSGVVPKVATLKRFIHMISEMGYTELYLGLSDAYKIKEEPYFNYKRGGYTTDDLREIDAYAKQHNMDVIANIQLLGHLDFLKKYPEYTNIFDTANVLMVGEERTYELIDHMFQAISEGLSSRRIHIGLDETYGLGTGAYAKKHGKSDKKELLLKHLLKVKEIAQKYNYTCEAWGDMLIETHATQVTASDVKAVLPENMLIYLWDYDTKEENELDEIIQNYKEHTDNVGFAGCVWKYLGFAPNLKYSIEVMLPQMDACHRNGIEHYMVTLWADHALPTSIYSCLPALYVAAEYANGFYNGVDNLDKEKFYRIVGMNYDDLYALEYINYPLKITYDTKSSSAFWVFYNDILLGNFDLFLHGQEDQIAKNYEALEQQYAALANGEFGHLFKKSEHLMRVLKAKVSLTRRIREAYKSADKAKLQEIIKEMKQLIQITEEFIEVYEEYHLHDNRGFGIEVNQLYMGSTIYRLKYAIRRIENFIRNDEKIDELEDGILPINYYPELTIHNSCFNDYRMLISYCIR